MFYGLAWYRNTEGERVDLIIRNLRSKRRLNAEREVRRICRNNGYIFDSVHLARNHRQKQGEINPNYSMQRERHKALAEWGGRYGKWVKQLNEGSNC